MTKPTEQQIREFWEGYGQFEECGYCAGTSYIYSSPTTYSQCKACEGWGYFAPRAIDLNNLWKYAIPKAIDILADIDLSTSTEAYYKLFEMWLKQAHNSGVNADALFWALSQVKDAKK